jgi:hypothetical protein
MIENLSIRRCLIFAFIINKYKTQNNREEAIRLELVSIYHDEIDI